MIIAPQQVHIWQYRVDPSNLLEGLGLATLDSSERERAARYYNEQDRLRYCCVQLFKRKLLSSYIGVAPSLISFDLNEYGKPFICADQNHRSIQYNLSYRGDYALIAVAQGAAIGIDIEKEIPIHDKQAFLDTYFSASEQQWIDRKEKEEQNAAILRCWTFKEAYVKALGTGFATHLASIDLSAFLTHEKSFVLLNGQDWTIRSLSAPNGYYAAIACSGEVDPVFM